MASRIASASRRIEPSPLLLARYAVPRRGRIREIHEAAGFVPVDPGKLADMARILYKPLGVFISVLGGLVAGAIFKRVWGAVAREEEPPKPTDEQRGWSEIIAAATVEGAVFGGVKAVVDRAGASGFARLTGAWPGESKS